MLTPIFDEAGQQIKKDFPVWSANLVVCSMYLSVKLIYTFSRLVQLCNIQIPDL